MVFLVALQRSLVFLVALKWSFISLLSFNWHLHSFSHWQGHMYTSTNIFENAILLCGNRKKKNPSTQGCFRKCLYTHNNAKTHTHVSAMSMSKQAPDFESQMQVTNMLQNVLITSQSAENEAGRQKWWGTAPTESHTWTQMVENTVTAVCVSATSMCKEAKLWPWRQCYQIFLFFFTCRLVKRKIAGLFFNSKSFQWPKNIIFLLTGGQAI